MGGKLHLAPLCEESARILDLGTGNGIWCVEMGEQCPSASIVGTDLCLAKPSRTPYNVKFEMADFEDEWPWDRRAFDFIHIRFNTMAVLNWPRLFARAIEALRPGGYIEVVDVACSPRLADDTIPEDSQAAKFFELLSEGCRQVGRDLDAPLKWRVQAREAGFVNVEERVFKVPIGRWHEEEKWKAVGDSHMEMLKVGRQTTSSDWNMTAY